MHRLSHGDERASVVVFRNGVDKLLGEGGADALFRESTDQAFDDTFLNVKRKVVQNKHGRLNNCYADEAQAPDIPNGRGTVIAFDSAPCMKELRAKLPALLGKGVKNLYAESNLYTDVRRKEVGIGFHGDTRRSVVVGVRLGKAQQPLRFLWYQSPRSSPRSTSSSSTTATSTRCRGRPQGTTGSGPASRRCDTAWAARPSRRPLASRRVRARKNA